MKVTWNEVIGLLIAIGIVLSLALFSGCLNYRDIQEGQPWFPYTQNENANEKTILGLELEIAAHIGTWELSDVARYVNEISIDAREKPLTPERHSFVDSEGRYTNRVWRFIVANGDALSVPTVSWREMIRTSYVLTANAFNGRLTSVRIDVKPSTLHERDLTTKHLVLGTAALGTSIFLVGQ